MTCLYTLDYSPFFSLLPASLHPVHTWATSMLTDVTRRPQPRLRSVLLKEHVSRLKLISSRPSTGHDAKRWLQHAPVRQGKEE